MKYGYARVSTDGQSLDAQVKQLRAAGAGKVFREVASGARTDRAQLRRVIGQLEKGDVLTVTRLDRLARSTRDLLDRTRRKVATSALALRQRHARLDKATSVFRLIDRRQRLGLVREATNWSRYWIEQKALWGGRNSTILDGERPRCRTRGSSSTRGQTANHRKTAGGSTASSGGQSQRGASWALAWSSSDDTDDAWHKQGRFNGNSITSVYAEGQRREARKLLRSSRGNISYAWRSDPLSLRSFKSPAADRGRRTLRPESHLPVSTTTNKTNWRRQIESS